MTAEKIPLVAVMGSPIAHSKSPMLHGYWLRKYGIKGHYIPIDVDPTHLSQVLETMSKMGFVGANVTIPHKENILKLADKISDRAAMIGAANTLSFSANGQIYADNTDGYGFIENIRQHQPTWKASEGPALILGAGGLPVLLFRPFWKMERRNSGSQTVPARAQKKLHQILAQELK